MHYILLVLFLNLFCLTPAESSSDSSLDSMWIDQESPTIEKKTETNEISSSSLESKKDSLAVSTGKSLIPATVAPMCTLQEFKSSSLVSKNAWPGLGPFKDGINASLDKSKEVDLVDENQNHLKVILNGEQVSSVELSFGKLGEKKFDLSKDNLDIQMTTNFLLEALGAKPKKIVEFNSQLEKNRELLRKGKSLSLVAGRYQVFVDPSSNAQPYTCLIAVNSLDANKSVLQEHANSQETLQSTQTKVVSAITENLVIKRLIPEFVKKPVQASKSIVNKNSNLPAATSTTKAVTTISQDPKKDEFVGAIKSWQQVKKSALRKRDSSHLTEILAGKALAKQSDAVKWLQTHQKYYDMEPRGATVEKYQDLGQGKKFLVTALVREFSKYIDESSGQVLKEVDDRYTVNYTMEKNGDKWLIIDSAVIPSNSSSQNSSNSLVNKSTSIKPQR